MADRENSRDGCEFEDSRLAPCFLTHWRRIAFVNRRTLYLLTLGLLPRTLLSEYAYSHQIQSESRFSFSERPPLDAGRHRLEHRLDVFPELEMICGTGGGPIEPELGDATGTHRTSLHGVEITLDHIGLGIVVLAIGITGSSARRCSGRSSAASAKASRRRCAPPGPRFTACSPRPCRRAPRKSPTCALRSERRGPSQARGHRVSRNRYSCDGHHIG
jgi:hypothetical protein